MENIKTVAVIGLGYIGLPTAAILASKGIDVVGVDVKQSTVDAVNRGEVPFVEPDLGTYLAGAVSQGTLAASTKTPHADAYIIAVPTPFKDNHAADLSFIEAAADAIAPKLFGGELIILESTCPPGATQHLANRVLALRPDLDQRDEESGLHFAHCPERVLPGQVMIELVTNDRIVGGVTPRAAARAKALYETFCQGAIHLTDAKTAEMAKLVENSFRDVNIAFANELSIISDKIGIDVWELIELANHHPRVNILQPGPGVGGHCIAVDPWFIVSAAPDEAKIIRMARDVNDAKPGVVIRRVLDTVEEIGAKSISILGLAFKADIDDLRESPALAITEAIVDALPDVTFSLVEPNVEALPSSLAERRGVVLCRSTSEVLETDLIVLLVDHSQFTSLNQDWFPEARRIDTKGLWR